MLENFDLGIEGHYFCFFIKKLAQFARLLQVFVFVFCLQHELFSSVILSFILILCFEELEISFEFSMWCLQVGLPEVGSTPGC